ncbi:MAG: amidohydrolase family protein [Bdellovibrionales bacterium]|nr:amidohydrolase family protein [Bdellovibrionales bacterium]
MAGLIDVHVHVFPDLLAAGRLPPALGPALEILKGVRRKGRGLFEPVSSGFHQIQPMIRHLPGPLRKGLEQLGGLASVPMLAMEATATDLLEAMDADGVEQSFVIAHPPTCSNELVLELARGNPRLIPVVNIPRGTERPGARLKEYARQGARLLKIHTAVDGETVDSPRYRALLSASEDLGLPVILHTGCIHLAPLYRDPELARVERLVPWFEKHRGLRFILAHMNFSEPTRALDLCEDFSNLWVDTSWQPAETIAEAVRRLGAERVLFGSDWPLVGHNIQVSVARVRDCVRSGQITENDAARIFRENALALLGKEPNDAS